MVCDVNMIMPEKERNYTFVVIHNDVLEFLLDAIINSPRIQLPSLTLKIHT